MQTFTVTYGGNPVTQAVIQNSDRRQTWIGYRVLGTSGSSTVAQLAVTIGGGDNTNVAVRAASYSGIHQTTPVTDFESFYTNDTTSTPIFPTTTNVNAGGYGIYTWASNETRTSDNETYTEHGEATSGISSGVASKAFASAGTTRPTVTFDDDVRASMSLVTLNPPPTSFTVTFNNNGGTGSMSNQVSNVPANLTTNTFTRTGFTFAGWNRRQTVRALLMPMEHPTRLRLMRQCMPSGEAR